VKWEGAAAQAECRGDAGGAEGNDCARRPRRRATDNARTSLSRLDFELPDRGLVEY